MLTARDRGMVLGPPVSSIQDVEEYSRVTFFVSFLRFLSDISCIIVYIFLLINRRITIHHVFVSSVPCARIRDPTTSSGASWRCGSPNPPVISNKRTQQLVAIVVFDEYVSFVTKIIIHILLSGGLLLHFCDNSLKELDDMGDAEKNSTNHCTTPPVAGSNNVHRRR